MKHNWNRTERLNEIKWKQNMQHYSFDTVSFCSCWVKPNSSFFPCLLKISRLLNLNITGTRKIHFSLQVQALIWFSPLGFGHCSRNLWCVLKKATGSHLCQNPMNIELILVLTTEIRIWQNFSVEGSPPLLTFCKFCSLFLFLPKVWNELCDSGMPIRRLHEIPGKV